MSLLYFPNQTSSSSSGSGKILQVVTDSKGDLATINSTTQAALGLSCTITPSSASNKIFCLAQINFGQSNNSAGYFFLLRDSTVVGGGTSGTDSVTSVVYPYTNSNVYFQNANIAFMDSPSSTSAITYSINWRALSAGSFTLYLNQRGFDQQWSTTSNLTVFEVDGT